MKDYRGEFNPKLTLTDFDHNLLAQYSRDIMLACHIHDRSALLPILLRFGGEHQTQIACDEWMSTSPIYNHRNSLLLDYRDDDVGAALKGFQLDIGAPHNYLNFHYELVSPTEGYFWTNTCGPFNYIHEMTQADEQEQIKLCHHMEDPTFDATVIAVNPKMRCRPVYRPPFKEIPSHGPCRWLVTIQDDIALAEDCPFLDHTSTTLAATFDFSQLPKTGGGLHDYSGDFKRDLCLEDLSHNMLAMVCKEFMLDIFLLNYSCHYAVGQRLGNEHREELLQEQYYHLAPVTVHRLRNTFGIEGDNVAAILKVLQLNPFVPKEYFDLEFAEESDSRSFMWLNDCAGYQEPVKEGIASLMITNPEQPGFDKLAKEVNPQAVVKPVGIDQLPASVDASNAVLAWEVVIDPLVEPASRSKWSDPIGHHMWDLDNSKHVFEYEKYDEK